MLTGIESAGKAHTALYSSLFVTIHAARNTIKGTIELAPPSLCSTPADFKRS
jgi:hypothetical protein